MSKEPCKHIQAIDSVKTADKLVCADCEPIGAKWVHLRTCQTCGVTRCCDSSPNRHSTKHSRASGHLVIASAEPGEQWLWCFEHEQMAGY